MQYFCFFLGGQEIGVEIEHVLETRALEVFTPLPNSPKYMVGIVNLRGEIIPIISLIKLFDMNQADYLNKIVYMKKDDLLFGFTINYLSKTCNIAPEEISPYPRNVSKQIREYYSGIIRKDNRTIQVLNLENLINFIQTKD